MVFILKEKNHFKILLGILILFSFNYVDTTTFVIPTLPLYPTIQSGIDAAVDGDTVVVSSGTYNEKIVINKQINVVAASSTKPIINGGGSGNVVNITASYVNFSGFEVRNGNMGIYIDHANYVNITNCLITSITGISAASGSGAAGGHAFGIYLNNSNNSIVERSIISSITGGNGGSNTAQYGYGGERGQ